MEADRRGQFPASVSLHVEFPRGDAHPSNGVVTRQETPIDVCAVSNIRIVIFSCRDLEDFLDEGLGALWLLEEKLDDSSQDLKLSLFSSLVYTSNRT